MSHAGWGALWNQALALLGAESIQFRILVGLGVAFVALMIIEGLRVSFLPSAKKRHAARTPAAPMPSEAKAVRKAAGAGTQTFEATPFRPRGKAWASSPKRAKGPVSRHRAERPKIRRIPGNSLQNSPVSMPSFTEEAVPYTPLPPNPG